MLCTRRTDENFSSEPRRIVPKLRSSLNSCDVPGNLRCGGFRFQVDGTEKESLPESAEAPGVAGSTSLSRSSWRHYCPHTRTRDHHGCAQADFHSVSTIRTRMSQCNCPVTAGSLTFFSDSHSYHMIIPAVIDQSLTLHSDQTIMAHLSNARIFHVNGAESNWLGNDCTRFLCQVVTRTLNP